MEQDTEQVSFPERDTRKDAMHSTVETWAEELVGLVDDATSSESFRKWLDVQSRFHDYSHRNTLLITLQYPEATRVAGYRTWQTEFDRHVKEGEAAIWIWAPIIAKRCPKCGNSKSYHEQSDCEYTETPPEEWSKGLVSFRPASVFDISQTEGEPLPELDTDARGDANVLLSQALAAADPLGVDVQFVADSAWSHGEANGICRHNGDGQPTIEVRERSSTASLVGVLLHEYAHASLHTGTLDRPERAKREVEAEAVAYLVGRYFGLDMSGSAFYLAAWHGEEPDVILDRLGRISETATEIIEAVDRD